MLSAIIILDASGFDLLLGFPFRFFFLLKALFGLNCYDLCFIGLFTTLCKALRAKIDYFFSRNFGTLCCKISKF